MITGFKHRALKRSFETGSKRGLSAEQAPKIRLILARLNASVTPKDLSLPGLYLHELTGKRKKLGLFVFQGIGGSPLNSRTLMLSTLIWRTTIEHA